MANVTYCVTSSFLSQIGFLCHNFGYRYARQPIKGLKDLDFSLVSNKNISQKIARWVGAQDQIKLAKNLKTLLFLIFPTENPILKNKF